MARPYFHLVSYTNSYKSIVQLFVIFFILSRLVLAELWYMWQTRNFTTKSYWNWKNTTSTPCETKCGWRLKSEHSDRYTEVWAVQYMAYRLCTIFFHRLPLDSMSIDCLDYKANTYCLLTNLNLVLFNSLGPNGKHMPPLYNTEQGHYADLFSLTRICIANCLQNSRLHPDIPVNWQWILLNSKQDQFISPFQYGQH